MTNNSDPTGQFINTFFRFNRAMRKRFTVPFSVQDLTPMQLQTLMALHELKNPTMSDISNHFGVTLPTATKLVERLVQMKMINRLDDKTDRRVTRLQLTAKGGQSMAELVEKHRTNLKQMLVFLDKEDIKSVTRILNELTLKMEESDEKSV